MPQLMSGVADRPVGIADRVAYAVVVGVSSGDSGLAAGMEGLTVSLAHGLLRLADGRAHLVVSFCADVMVMPVVVREAGATQHQSDRCCKSEHEQEFHGVSAEDSPTKGARRHRPTSD